MSNKNMITSHQRHMEGKRDYCSHFSVTFETTGNFLIDFVRYILRKKKGVDGVTRPRREIDVRYELYFKKYLEKI